jgi:hypothetical protein
MKTNVLRQKNVCVLIGFNILKTIPGYRKLCVRWVPQMLIPGKKEQRVQACAHLLE